VVREKAYRLAMANGRWMKEAKFEETDVCNGQWMLDEGIRRWREEGDGSVF
jgi:hypothetical protein